MMHNSQSSVIYTIGHSTRSINDFIELLKAYHIAILVDVRTIPRSRHNPQFNIDELPTSLSKVDIRYLHIAELGGLRHAKKDSINTGWRNASFRGFADYMQTPEFREGIEKLIQLSHASQIAIMCSEAVPWRCHRSLISDALLIRGIHCEDIQSPKRTHIHHLTKFAAVKQLEITYPLTAF